MNHQVFLGVLIGWPKSSFRFFSITSYRKTQTKLLAHPLPYTEVLGIYEHTMSLFYKALSALSGPWVPNILVILPGPTTGETRDAA